MKKLGMFLLLFCMTGFVLGCTNEDKKTEPGKTTPPVTQPEKPKDSK